MRVLITGGGTGGHIYPGVTIAQTLKTADRETEILFVGCPRSLEADIIPREGFELETIPLIGLPRKISWRMITAGRLALSGLAAARRIIRRFQPSIAVGTGGYVCGPVMLAAALARVPTAIQEQNAYPGLTNRILGRLVQRVFLAYDEAAPYFDHRKVRLTGNPIRSAITTTMRSQGAERLELDPALFTLLVVGASQGARSINEAVLASLPSLLLQPRLQVLHITGWRDYEAVREAMGHLNLPPGMLARVHTVPYLYEIADAYAVTDLVISRAGAIGLAEMTSRGMPMILIPYPHAAGDHQTFNARSLERRGAARVIPDHDLTSGRLLAEVLPLVRDPSVLGRMKRASQNAGNPDASREIVAELFRMAGCRVPPSYLPR